MLRRKLSLGIALPILLVALGLTFMGVNRAAVAATETPKTVWGDTQCLKCHTDLATIKKMQEKKGDNTFCQAAYEQIQKDEKAATASSGKSSWSGSYPAK